MDINNLKINKEKLNNIYENDRTWYASIDQPWLQQYKSDPRKFDYEKNKSIWTATKEVLEKYRCSIY